MNKLRIVTKLPKAPQGPSSKPEKDRLMSIIRNPNIEELDEEALESKREMLNRSQDHYRQKIKLMGRAKILPKSENKRTDSSEATIPKVQKLQILNQLLTKKNQLLEQNLEKLKQENKLLRKAAYMALENKDVNSSNWRKQFEENMGVDSIDGNDIFPELRRNKPKELIMSHEREFMNQQKGFYDDYDPRQPNKSLIYQPKAFNLEEKNKNFLNRLKQQDDSFEKRSDISTPMKHWSHNKTIYEEDMDKSKDNEDIQALLDDAISKIKAMEYELEVNEKKIEFLENELENQKRINSFNERSYMKLQENQRQLMDENSKLHKTNQELAREINRFRGSTFGSRQ